MTLLLNKQPSPRRFTFSAFYQELRRIGNSVLSAYIHSISLLPQMILYEIGIMVEEKSSKELFHIWKTHYSGLSKWLDLLLLGNLSLINELNSPTFVHLRSYAELAVSQLEWSRYVQSKLEYTKYLNSGEELWFFIQASNFYTWMQLSGFTGVPATGDKGRLIGKTEGIQHDLRGLRELRELIKPSTTGREIHPKKPRKPLENFDYESSLLEILFCECIAFIEETDDLEFQDVCYEAIKAEISFRQKISKGDNSKFHRVLYKFSEENLFIPEKNVRTPRIH